MHADFSGVLCERPAEEPLLHVAVVQEGACLVVQAHGAHNRQTEVLRRVLHVHTRIENSIVS